MEAYKTKVTGANSFQLEKSDEERRVEGLRFRVSSYTPYPEQEIWECSIYDRDYLGSGCRVSTIGKGPRGPT